MIVSWLVLSDDKRAEPSVIVAGSNSRASESEKGCGCLGRKSMTYVCTNGVRMSSASAAGACGYRMCTTIEDWGRLR